MDPFHDDAIREWRSNVSAVLEDGFGIEYFRDCYRRGEYPHEFLDELVDRGWIGATLPEAYGGQGRGQLEQVVLLEVLGRYGYDFGIPVVTSTTVAENVLEYGTDQQRERFLPALITGKCRFSVGVTEPGTGSDAASLETRARLEPEDSERAEALADEGSEEPTYVVNGEKTYQSGAQAPGTIICAYVRTDPDVPKREGISALLIPNDLEGVETTELSLVARKAVGTAQVSFDDVRVPARNRIGAEGDGWGILSEHLIREHLGLAALMVGNAQTVVDAAADEAVDRERFGKPIGHFQAIGHRLADLQTEVDAARLLVYRAARALDADEGSRRLAAEAKLKAGEVLRSASSAGMQILGGTGLDADGDMQRYWREGASATIAGGTSEIQRSIISRDILSGRNTDTGT